MCWPRRAVQDPISNKVWFSYSHFTLVHLLHHQRFLQHPPRQSLSDLHLWTIKSHHAWLYQNASQVIHREPSSKFRNNQFAQCDVWSEKMRFCARFMYSSRCIYTYTSKSFAGFNLTKRFFFKLALKCLREIVFLLLQLHLQVTAAKTTSKAAKAKVFIFDKRTQADAKSERSCNKIQCYNANFAFTMYLWYFLIRKSLATDYTTFMFVFNICATDW